MPTPIEHLTVAEHLLTSPELPESIRVRLEHDKNVRSAFFFGHIAPDVQAINNQSRETTHFFSLPPVNHRPAYERMLTAHPPLAQPANLTPDQTAFLAGYISHLMLDECWVRKVFYPVFGPEQTWGDRRERLLLHNALRAWLAQRDLPSLRTDIGDLLRLAEPTEWLPFVTDTDLKRWRNLVADQFAPGAEIRTVEIFANRARIPDAEFSALLMPEVMEKRIFGRISLTELEQFRNLTLVQSLDLTIRFLNGCTGCESG